MPRRRQVLIDPDRDFAPVGDQELREHPAVPYAFLIVSLDRHQQAARGLQRRRSVTLSMTPVSKESRNDVRRPARGISFASAKRFPARSGRVT